MAVAPLDHAPIRHKISTRTRPAAKAITHSRLWGFSGNPFDIENKRDSGPFLPVTPDRFWFHLLCPFAVIRGINRDASAFTRFTMARKPTNPCAAAISREIPRKGEQGSFCSDNRDRVPNIRDFAHSRLNSLSCSTNEDLGGAPPALEHSERRPAVAIRTAIISAPRRIDGRARRPEPG